MLPATPLTQTVARFRAAEEAAQHYTRIWRKMRAARNVFCADMRGMRRGKRRQKEAAQQKVAHEKMFHTARYSDGTVIKTRYARAMPPFEEL